MRFVLGVALLAALGTEGSARPWAAPPAAGTATDAPAVRFEVDVAPILSRCRPCHYPGGVMHARLPFDDETTVRKAGEKLFTRIKDEKQRAVLRSFFAAAH